MQTRECESFDLPMDSTIPKFNDFRDAKSHEVFIPETEMKLEADWHFGIKKIRTRLPCHGRHHRGELILEAGRLMRNGHITDSLKNLLRAKDRFLRAVQINVAL